jgi:hypothetical protein
MKVIAKNSPFPGLSSPNTPDTVAQLALFAVLALSMVATRYHHFSSVLHIADTSWAAFFLAGLYLRARWMFVALLGLAVVIDLAALWMDGLGQTGCFSPAYPGLLLAYGALWGAGRLGRSSLQWDQSRITAILAIAGWVTLGVLTAFALSNLSFWAWSGHFGSLSLGDYLNRVMGYLGHYMTATSLYVGLGVAAMAAAHTLSVKSAQTAH